MQHKIGVIDSGVGGLTVAKEIIHVLPQESFIYFGDTARCPYGNKSIDEIKTYVWDMIDFLMTKNIKALVVACNTATAIMVDELKQKLPIPVIGVIEPGARAANLKSKTGNIGVIATTRTVESGVYEKTIQVQNDSAIITSRACPLLVPLIEKNEMDTPEALDLIQASLYPLKKKEIDTLVLGCTHYPIIAKQIDAYFEGRVQLVDPAQETVRELYQTLSNHQLLHTQGIVEHEYYVSGDVEGFNQVASAWCERQIQAELHEFNKKSIV